jgi:hypothetical protein
MPTKKEFKIELKKLQIFERMSEETTAFAAEIYVNGINVGYAKNDGHGGSTYYHSHEGKRDILSIAESYCVNNLPPKRYPASNGMRAFEIKMNLEHFIDGLVEDELLKKERKKIEKKFTNHIIWGVPNGNTYNQVKFKRAFIPQDRAHLQKYIDEQVKPQLFDGEQILNTNLQALGVVV